MSGRKISQRGGEAMSDERATFTVLLVIIVYAVFFAIGVKAVFMSLGG